MFNNMWDVKEPKHYSKRVGREVPGVVAVLCVVNTGPMLIAVTTITEMAILYKYVEIIIIREVKHDVRLRQTVGSCVSPKHENLRFSTCLTLLRSYSIHLGNRQERGLNKSSFSVFWQKENFILPFAVNFMLNLSIHVTRVAPHSPMSAPLTPVMQATW